MKSKPLALAGGALIAAVAFGAPGVIDAQTKKPAAPARDASAASQNSDRQADREAIQQASRAFVDAFTKGDAKAVAAHWTEQGEFQTEDGAVFRGRAAIETAYSEFFKKATKSRLEITIHSIRFLGRDIAVEEGSARQSQDGPDLPTSSEYSAIHVRENGEWKIAICRDFAAAEDRLHDIHWLLGTWKGAMKDQEAELTFEQDKAQPVIHGRMTKRIKGEVAGTGTFRISIDPQTGQLRSWHFESDGGHGQALWFRDGNQWHLEARNVMADGTAAAALNVLTRINNNEITWRSIDRVIEDQPLPDTLPIKLTRVAATK